ncbi:MAG: ABC transporter ATP-binding protein [Xanthobacteraceae bacterium]
MQTVGTGEGRAKRDFAPWADPTLQPLLRIEGLTKRFGAYPAVDNLSLDIYPGEFFALLGPSGCGKTTLLRLIAGFERAGAGRIFLEGADLLPVPPHRRPVNMMFQSYALFPHLTVAGNVAFGLKQEGLPKAQIAERVAEMLALVRLQDFGARRPHELSGGQRQRVALARALIKRPRILLLDEPMAALDKKLRGETQFELMELQRRLGLTFIIVTHDQSEAMTVADRIAVMDRGRLMQVAPPAEIYEQPSSRWVADFIGSVNLLEGRVGSDGTSVEGTALGRLRVAAKITAEPGATVWVAVRPERLRMAPDPAESDAEWALESDVAATLADVAYLGDLSVYRLRTTAGVPLQACRANVGLFAGRTITANDKVWLNFARTAAIVLTQ